jgi:uncharacterized protein
MEFGISPYILAGASAWLVAQLIKYIVASVKARSPRQLRQFYLSGNMPSAHSATVIAVTTVIGLLDGVDTAVFGLALTFSAVVMYDAVTVRRSSGEQGAALLAYFKEVKSKIMLPRVAKGHLPLEVAVGAALGVVVGIVVFLATRIS